MVPYWLKTTTTIPLPLQYYHYPVIHTSVPNFTHSQGHIQKPVGEMMFQPGRLMTTHPDNGYFHSTMPWPCHIPSDKRPVHWIDGKYPPIHPHPFPNVQLTVYTVYWATSISPASCPRHAVRTVSCTLPNLYPPYFPHSLDLNRRLTLEKLVEAGVWSTGKIKALYPRRQRINHGITPRI